MPFSNPFFTHADTIFSFTPQISATWVTVRYFPLGIEAALLDTDFVS